jgi:hypothetical protein
LNFDQYKKKVVDSESVTISKKNSEELITQINDSLLNPKNQEK